MKKILTIIVIACIVCMIPAFKFGHAKPVSNVNKNHDYSGRNVIVYNTHTFEKYNYGESIKDVSKVICSKLSSESVKNMYIDNTYNDYNNSYEKSKDVILKSDADYKNSVLLDIHRGGDAKFTDGITFYIGKKNINFEKNKQFAENILKRIKGSNPNIDVKIAEENAVYNQDISDMAETVLIGNTNTSKDLVEKDINVLVDALCKIIR